ncbi:small-conductance mechanosensitive channel [Hasllibacter halocynthiae]|uniref:Small-conductance mechanosensitive channel n=1 Tax=Hasllibacter halocynthiae TaxID=595589 RepID=A0A2T0X7M2_9RHOB|nr:mechanosensitive ion channel family protein [Hasllibacter halocynthiae]PRY94933.1 small-conductance mechanosensitive channel [Hasllibacter halocynthiae]
MPLLRALLLALILPALFAGAAQAQPEPFFEVDGLNEGLGPPPEDLDRETPQAALESFLRYADEGRWEAAAHLLDLAEVDPAEQSVRGPLLAERLAVVLDRKVVLSWGQLVDRPDGLDARATSDSATAGQVRRSFLLGVLGLGEREVEARLNRLKPGEDADPVWVFSRQTVENVPALYDLYGPSEFERWLPEWAKRDVVAGLAVWELAMLPLVLAVAFGAGALTWRVLRDLGRRMGETIVGDVVEALRWPAAVLVTTLLLDVLTGWLFVFSAAVDTVVEPAVAIGYVLAALLLFMMVFDAILNRLVTFDTGELSDPGEHQRRSWATGLSAIRRIVLVILAVAGIGIVLTVSNVFQGLGLSLLASSTALTIVLGFAARRVLGNIMASIQIALNRSARIGDQILYEDKWCTVERIHFTFVQLKIWTDNRLIVPVEEFVSSGFVNYTLENTEMTRTIRLTLAHGAQLDPLREEFEKLVAEDDRITDEDECQLRVTDHDALGLTARFQFPVPDPSTGWDVECELREKLLAAAARIEDERGIAMLPEGAAMDAAA